MSPEGLAQVIKDSLGPDWWAAQVTAQIVSAQFLVAGSIIVMAAYLIVGTIGTRSYFAEDGRFSGSEDFGWAMVFWWGVGGFISVIALCCLITGVTNLATPDLAVWQELVRDVSAVLR